MKTHEAFKAIKNIANCDPVAAAETLAEVQRGCCDVMIIIDGVPLLVTAQFSSEGDIESFSAYLTDSAIEVSAIIYGLDQRNLDNFYIAVYEAYEKLRAAEINMIAEEKAERIMAQRRGEE